MSDGPKTPAGERLAKVIARAGLCSRRDAEGWIKEGRVSVNSSVIRSPAFNVTDKDRIAVDGAPLAARQGTRVWLYHKPPGLVVTEKDPEGRPTIFEKFEELGLPRVLTVGRLDLNTEGLLLLTNDGGLKRVLELPATGWLRRYRVRAFGTITQAQLDVLKAGIEVDGVHYGPIEATLEREQGSNVWLVVALREGKNREVKNVLASLGLVVNRLIRVSYGPFQLGDIPVGGIEPVRARVLRDQLGKKLAADAGADFESEMPESPVAPRKPAADPAQRLTGRPRRVAGTQSRAPRDSTDRPRGPAAAEEERPIRHRPGRPDTRPPRKPKPERPLGPARRILFDDGREESFHPPAPREDRPREKFGDKPAGRFGDKPAGKFGDKPAGKFGDRPRGDRPARAAGDKPRAERPAGRITRSPRDPDSAGRAGDRPPRRDSIRPARPSGPGRDSDRPARADRPQRRDGPARPAGAGRPERKSYGGAGKARPPGGPARPPRPSGGPARGPGGPTRSPGGPARGPGGPSRGPGGPGTSSRGPRPGGKPRTGGPRPTGKPPRKPRA